MSTVWVLQLEKEFFQQQHELESGLQASDETPALADTKTEACETLGRAPSYTFLDSWSTKTAGHYMGVIRSG